MMNQELENSEIQKVKDEEREIKRKIIEKEFEMWVKMYWTY